MNLIKLVPLLFLLFSGMSYSVSDTCEISLKEIFGKEVSQNGAKEFLHLQGQITLHRLAWAYLKANGEDEGNTASTVERTIIELLNDKYTRSDPGFVKARKAFEEQPLSRTTLAEIGPYLKDLLSEKFKEEDQDFVINESDLKLLGILARRERETAKAGVYDHRMLNSKSPTGMLNFVKLINSSYGLSKDTKDDDLNIELKLRGLEKVLISMQKRMSDLLNKMELPVECKEECNTDLTMNDFFQANEDVQKIFWNAILEDRDSDSSLLGKLTYGEMWLQVSGKPRVQTSSEKKITSKTSTPVRKTVKKKVIASPKKIEEAGVIVEDPIGVILKDRSGRKRADWKSFDKDYLQSFARSILENKKVFEHKGKLFNRQTGKGISPEDALKGLPPKRQEQSRKLLTSAEKSIKVKFAEALANGDETFVVGEKLYDKSGKSLNPAIVISSVMSAKTGAKYEASRYKGLSNKYLAERANALKNNKPYFKVDGVTLDTFTGRNISSPFRKNTITDAKIEKNRRKIFENLSDLEVIKNFHRDEGTAGCNYYGVIDKGTAKFTVYQKSGKEVFRSEVLIGAEESDKRTRWTTYNSNTRIASNSTGAGVYTIREQNLNDSYNKKNFNNNILSFLDESKKETVFAIHQVPVGLQSRYSRFGTNDPEDRRISGGCANLKLSDFQAARKWLKPSCKVYVLPEEKNNKFIVKDNSIKLISETAVSSKVAGLYYYDTNKSKALPISIKIVNKEGETEKSKTFVKALSTEKEKLMKMYGLSNDEYNDLAMLAYGILGNESDFGRSTKLKIKENAQFAVITARLIKTGDRDVASNTSRGLTQIKYLPDGIFSKEYPEIKKENLTNPRNAAVATLAYLALAAKQMKQIARENKADASKLRITRENMMDYMGYLYQGGRGKLSTSEKSKQATPEFNGYYRNLKLHMSYIELRQAVQ